MPEEPHEVQKVVLEQWYKNITFWQKLMQYAIITGLFLDYQCNVDSRQNKFIVKTTPLVKVPVAFYNIVVLKECGTVQRNVCIWAGLSLRFQVAG